MKETIVTDPAKWPTDTFGGRGTYNHIRFDQPKAPPEAFWSKALPQFGKRRVSPFQYWWRDLSGFDPSLKGWKLTGHGGMPLTVLNPKEAPHRTDIKIALRLAVGAVTGLPDDDFEGVDPSPFSLDLAFAPEKAVPRRTLQPEAGMTKDQILEALEQQQGIQMRNPRPPRRGRTPAGASTNCPPL